LAPGQRIGYAALHPDFPDRRRSVTGSSSSSSPPGGASRMPCSSTRSATSNACRSTSMHSRRAAIGWCRPSARWATRSRTRRARSISWRVRPTRRPRVLDAPRRARHARPARHDRGVGGLVPDLADGQRPDGRGRPRCLPRGSTVG
jgi:hypothetical protein